MRRAVYAGIQKTADVLWGMARAVDRRFPERSFKPKWAPAPLLKQREKTFPPLGFPRQTDSLCPRCVTEVRTQILSGDVDWKVLIEGNPGEIKASIVEEDGRILMRKDCPKHGRFEDVMSTDPEFFRRLESLYPGRDFVIPKDGLHEHGTSSIKYGRGAVLTIDLTNRCNMMCNPCFMDANQVGYVHELEWEEVQKMLDDAASIKPRRQLSVQFSGGEPTLSPHFLPAVRYARKLGYFSVQCATNGIRFAQDESFAKEAAEAGLRFAYLQFDGVGNEHNEHRKVGNLYDVKLRAIENLHKHGVDVTLVVTIVNGINNDQVGDIIRFGLENIDKVTCVAFQPVSFTGRDEDIDDETRTKQRYTLSHLAHDVKTQAGIGEPMRDWYPLSAAGPFSDLKDLLGGLESEWGSFKCGCHPNCGIGMLMLVEEKTKKAVTVPVGPERGPHALGHQGRHRLGPNEGLDRGPDGPLGPSQPAARGNPGGPDALEGRPGDGRPHRRQARLLREEARLLARPLHRRDVVPGPLQLRLPPHRDVHHPVRDADGRDLLLRVQHGRGLAKDHRGDVPDGVARRLVQEERPPRGLRPRAQRPVAGAPGPDRARVAAAAGGRARPRGGERDAPCLRRQGALGARSQARAGLPSVRAPAERQPVRTSVADGSASRRCEAARGSASAGP